MEFYLIRDKIHRSPNVEPGRASKRGIFGSFLPTQFTPLNLQSDDSRTIAVPDDMTIMAFDNWPFKKNCNKLLMNK